MSAGSATLRPSLHGSASARKNESAAARCCPPKPARLSIVPRLHSGWAPTPSVARGVTSASSSAACGLSSAQPRQSPPPHIKSHEFSIMSYRRKNPTQKLSSTFTTNRPTSEPKRASANRQLGSASNSCRSQQQENDNKFLRSRLLDNFTSRWPKTTQRSSVRLRITSA
jgi:hypothetical protein